MKIIKEISHLIYGFLQFSATKRNSEKSHQAFVKLYSISNGISNSMFSIIIKISNYFSREKNNSYLSKNSNNIKINDNQNIILQSIKEKSYYKFDSKLSNEVCEDIIRHIHSIQGYGNKDKNRKINVIERKSDINYINFHENDLMKNKSLQKLSVNEFFLNISRNYFGSEPILSNIGIAITYPSNKPMSEFAQLYHFDLDRIKWLKFFIYLSDVSLDEGPHSYIEGTHKVLDKPYELVKKGYKRIPDEEFFRHVDKSKEKIVTGEKGTIFVGDSSAFHKGNNPKKNNRIMLQFEYCNSLFGGMVEKVEVSENIFDKDIFSIENIKTSKLFSRFNFLP